LPQSLILQNVERRELPRIHALQAQDLDAGPREPALRRLGRAFHEQHHGRRGHGFVDGEAGLGGEEAWADERARGADRLGRLVGRQVRGWGMGGTVVRRGRVSMVVVMVV
jgi:hypothetical protein